MVQIRNEPEALHRKLKAQGPTRARRFPSIHRRSLVTLKTTAAAVIREGRDSA
jgi:hypothetical protein